MEKQAYSQKAKGFVEPQGAPRGLLMHYVLHKLSLKPAYGYEILRDIEGKSGGVWRPGPSSIYPLLKKLEATGLIQASGEADSGTPHKVYSITEKGLSYLAEARKKFLFAGQKWESVGRLLVELVDPADIPLMISRASTAKFDLTKELVEAKLADLPKADLVYALTQYRLGLKRQLEWVDGLIARLGGTREEQ